MGVTEASITAKKSNNLTPSNQNYISFDSTKILYNGNISKNLKEVISINTDKKISHKISIINPINFSKSNGTNKTSAKNNNNYNLYQKKKSSILKSKNNSKTVDRKMTNNNNSNTSNSNNKNNSLNKKNISYLRDKSKKYLKTSEKKNNNINNINSVNIHNNSSKEVIPFYYKPKRILTQKNNNRNKGHINNKSNGEKDLRNNNMSKNKSKETMNSKNISCNKNNENKGIDMHRSFNKISRISSSDKFNLVNNSYVKKKISYKIEHMTDVHNHYNEWKNKPLYLIDDISSHYSKKKNDTNYSNENGFNNAIRNDKNNFNKLKICLGVLKLKERKWQEEMTNINKLISINRIPNNHSNHININYILQKIIVLYDHFNWVIKSIAFIYNCILYENKRDIFNNLNLGSLNFPSFDSILWFKGFKWKGLYIRIEKDINCANDIKKEIKALNYFLFDYLHIIWNDDKILDDFDIKKHNSILSNNIIFPLIGYSQINSFILIVSSIIKPEKNINNNLVEFIEQSNGIIELCSNFFFSGKNIYGNKINKNSKLSNRYHYKDNLRKHNHNFYNINLKDINENKYIKNKINHSIYFINNRNKNINSYNKNENNNNKNENNNDLTYFKDFFYIKDLLKSKLFTEIGKNNLIKVRGGKYMLINIKNIVPNLFENKFCNNIKKINFFGVVDGEKKYYTLNYNSSSKINIKNILNNNNSFYKYNDDSNEKKKNCSINTPKNVLEKIYNIYPSDDLKFKNVIIGNLFFRILYINSHKTNIISKKNFVDILFNFNNEKEINNYSHNLMNHEQINNENERKEYYTYIQEPYVIIYDIIEPIKLDYSLIKSIKMKDNQTEVIKNIYFLRTNYINYFLSWCDMFNKNSYNIKKYQDLKYFLKKYGINQNLLFFSLIKINNKEITDIIKIHLLVKLFKYICFQKDNENALNEIKNRIKLDENNQEVNYNNLKQNLKSKIIFYIKSVIYPNELLPIGQKFFKYIYEQLLFFSNILFFKYKLIDDYLSLGLINKEQDKNYNDIYSDYNINSPQEFMKHIILTARQKPFLFISEMEYKLNFIIDPFVKFKCSISIESMSHQLDVNHVHLNHNNDIKSFVDPVEISGLLLTKIIRKFKDMEIDSNDESINTVFKNNNFKYSKKLNEKNGINLKGNEYPSLSIKPAVLNTKVNILSIKNGSSNIREENENLEIKSNHSNININNNNNNSNSHTFLRNNSNISNIDNNEAATKISNDKTMDESDSSKTQISNILSNIDLNSNNIIHNNNLNKSKESKNLNQYRDIYENFILFLPPNCYKIFYNYENNISKNLYKNLEQSYFIKNIYVIKEWVSYNESIFKNISNSYNGNCEYSLFKSYIIYFLFAYYIEKSRKESIKVNNKILSIFKNNNSYYLSLNDLAIINLIQGLLNNNYVENEEYYSKSVMLLLMNYGDPRGRNNDSHDAMQFPLWEISRKTYKLEEPFINENFKEMYQALDFFDKKKDIFNIIKNNLYNVDYLSNIKTNFDKIRLMNNKIKNDKNGKNNIEFNDSESIYFMVTNIDENPNENYINKDLTDKNISLSNSIFDKTILGKACIKHNIFPSISSKMPNIGNLFHKKEFSIYIIKEIQSLLMGRRILLNKKYLDKRISEDLLTYKDLNSSFMSNIQKVKDISNNTFNETPLKGKYINNFNREKQFETTSSKTNPFFDIQKKCNNRNNQYLKRNNHLFNTANISKSYNNNINSSNGINSYIWDNKSNINNKNEKDNKNESNNRKTINNSNCKNNHLSQKSKKIFSHFLYTELLQKLSYKKNLPSGIIISFGNNPHNETSHDRYEKLTLPRVIFKLKNEIIKSISSGWQHNIVLNQNGEMFSFGHNQEYQCGLPNVENNNSDNENINDPTNISKIYDNLKAIKVCCGNEHSLIISKNKNVYGFGNNEDGLLGMLDKTIKTYKPTKINFIANNDNVSIEDYNGKIIDISCGTVHNLALTEDGKVFSWGSFQGGQLGLSSEFLLNENQKKTKDKEMYLSIPTLIPFFRKEDIKIKKISCGEAHSLALTEKGKVYSWGFGSNGQLGLGFCEDSFEPGQGLLKSRIFEPQLINNFKDYSKTMTNVSNYNCNNIKIKDIQCGKTFSLFINTTNNLYACGINDLNQLGFKELEPKDNLYNPEIQCDDYIYPTLLKCFNDKKVEKISCGEGHCLAIVNDINSNIQSVWSWGNNKFGQIGHGSIVKVSLPKEIDYLKGYNMNKFYDVSCGGFHSLVLLISKNNLDWIDKDYDESILEIIEEIGKL